MTLEEAIDHELMGREEEDEFNRDFPERIVLRAARRSIDLAKQVEELIQVRNGLAVLVQGMGDEVNELRDRIQKSDSFRERHIANIRRHYEAQIDALKEEAQ